MNHEQINQLNLMDQYVLGKLTPAQAEEFEDHFIDCPECIAELNLTRRFIQELKVLSAREELLPAAKVAAPAVAVQMQPARPWWSLSLWPTFACGCLALALLLFAVGVFFRSTRLSGELHQAKAEVSDLKQQRERDVANSIAAKKESQEVQEQQAKRIDELEQKIKDGDRKLKEEQLPRPTVGQAQTDEVNAPVAVLTPAVRAGVAEPALVEVPASKREVSLQIQLEDSKGSKVFRFKIFDARNRQVLQRGGFTPNSFNSLSWKFNVALLPPGTYEMIVEGLSAENEWTTVGNYPFKFTRR